MDTSSSVGSRRRREYRRIRKAIEGWARKQPDILGIALCGSWARGTERMDSDIDVVVLTADKGRYVDREDWIEQAIGATGRLVRTMEWGPVTERRILLPSGLEVEFGFAPPSWASTSPLDASTATVVAEGFTLLYDPDQVLATLVRAVGRGATNARLRWASGSTAAFRHISSRSGSECQPLSIYATC